MSTTPIARLFQDAERRPLPIVASVFTPYQLLFLERILGAVEQRPTLILDARGATFRAGRKPTAAGDIVEIPLTGKVNDAGQAALLREGMTAADRFTAGHDAVFIAASYQYPLNNAIYHHHRRDSRWRFVLQDDGLSSYLDLRPSPRERLRNPVRELVARLRGFPHRSMIAGHPLGHNLPELAGIVLGLPPGIRTPGAERVLVLAAQGDTIEYSPEAALFVGQPLLRDHGRERVSALVRGAAALLRARGYRQLGFKPHHFQPEEEVSIFLGNGFKLFNPPLPVEEALADSHFRTIVAVSSTALLTSKALYADSIKAIAINLTRFPPAHEQRDMAEVEALFRRAGVELETI